MHRFSPFAVAILGACLVNGCSKAPSNDSAATTTSSPAQNPSTEAVTRAATNFLDAVIKGDTQRASACLTPQAMQRIIASGKPFNPPGWDSLTYTLGQVRMPAVDRAFVSFLVMNVSDGKPTNDEVACALKLVENEWRVCGLAAWGPNQSVTELNFEADHTTPVQRRPAMPNTAATPVATPPAATALPPRVAQEPAATIPYQQAR